MPAQNSAKMLNNLQKLDPDVQQVATYAKFVVVHFKDDATGKWHQPGIEGPLYLVRRVSQPYVCLIVRNKLEGGGDIIDGVDADWEIDSKVQHIVYKSGDPSKNVRCLWFPEDAERMKVQATFEVAVNNVKEGKAGPLVVMHTGKKKKKDMKDGEKDERDEDETAGDLFKQFGIKDMTSGDGEKAPVMLTRKNLSDAFLACASDDAFLNMIMGKLNESVEKQKMAARAAQGLAAPPPPGPPGPPPPGPPPPEEDQV